METLLQSPDQGQKPMRPRLCQQAQKPFSHFNNCSPRYIKTGPERSWKRNILFITLGCHMPMTTNSTPRVKRTAPISLYMKMNYNGPNPQRLYEKIKEILFTVVRHDPNELMERDFAWDRSGGTEKFKTSFDLVKDLDTFSY